MTELDTNMISNTIATKVFHQAPVVIPYAANITPDLSIGNIFTVNMTGNMTLDNPTVVDNAFYYLYVTMDITGGYTFTLGSNWIQLGGSFNAGANKVNILSFSTFSGVTEIPLYINQRP